MWKLETAEVSSYSAKNKGFVAVVEIPEENLFCCVHSCWWSLAILAVSLLFPVQSQHHWAGVFIIAIPLIFLFLPSSST